MLRKVLPQGFWLLPGLADLCQGRKTLLGLASESQASSRLSLRQTPEAESYLFHPQHTRVKPPYYLLL